MSTAFLIFLGCMLAACSYAVMYGGRDERVGAIALAAAAILSPVAMIHRWAGPELGIILVDFALFVALAALAMKSRSFWPMWAAGFQLCAVAVHLVAAEMPHMVAASYAEALAIWSYPVLLTLAIGTHFESRMNHGHG